MATGLALTGWAWGAEAATTQPPPSPAPAGSAYRCADAAGKVSYSQLPCGPSPRTVNVADRRTPAQRNQAEQMRIRESKLARGLRKARLSAAAHAPAPTLLATHKPLPQPDAGKSAAESERLRQKHKKHRASSPYFTARTPIQPKVPAIPAAPPASP